MKNEDNETEILLGNKQLLGIFFAVAVLLGLAFTGGYVVGHGSSKKSSVAASTPSEAAAPVNGSASSGGVVGETHSVGAEPGGDASQASGTDSAGTQDGNSGDTEAPAKETAVEHPRKESSVAARKAKSEEAASAPEETPAPAASAGNLVPHSGQTFLQVAAVGRGEAEAVADVLHKKGFRAHAIPKPGSAKIYRVLIGPVRDAGDLSATRDSLRRAGFRDVIVQRY